MKKQKLKGIEIKYFNPEFDTFEATALVSVKKHPGFPDVIFPADKVEQKRNVTICQVIVPNNGYYMISTGIALMNPLDLTRDEKERERTVNLGKVIAEGRALRNNIKCVEVVTTFKPTTAIKQAVKELTQQHVQRNLNMYVTQMREALKM